MQRCVSKIRKPKEADRVAEMSAQPQIMDDGPKLTTSDAKRYLEEVKSRLTSENYVEFLDILKDYREHSIDIAGVKEKSMTLFNGDRKLLLGLNMFLPKELRIIFPKELEPDDVVKQLIDHIQMGLQGDHHLYISFLGTLDLYRTGKISVDEVQKKVAHLFQDHQALYTEFTKVLPYCHLYSIGDHSTRNENRSSPLHSKEETIASHAELGEGAGRADPDHEKSPVMTNKEHRRCHAKGKRKRSPTSGKFILGSKRSILSSKNKNKGKSLHDLDLSNCESCTPSYRLVPRHCPILDASHKTEMDKEVLNDHWVAVNYASEGHSFKQLLKNPHEKILFKLEDDRFEMDMGLERIMLTIKQAKVLMRKINDNSIKTDGLFRVEDYIPCPSLRCIEVIYGEYGLDMVDILRKDLSLSLPIILNRLKQKKQEWMMFSSNLNKISRETFVENHQRSLDHHGYYLKKKDSKSLCAKALLAEMNEISEARSKEDRPHQIPHMEFKFYDMDLHEDLFQLLKLYSAGICSSEQLDRVLKIWTYFVGPMFGLFPRHGCIDNNKHIAEATNRTGQNSYNCAKEDELIINTRESIITDNYLEFMTNEVEISPIVDLEKGGFAACMDDRMDLAPTSKDVNKPNYHNRHAKGTSGNEADADNIHVFYGDDAFYIFFRLHHALYSRLLEAKQSASEKWKGISETTPNDSYNKFLDILHKYLANKEKYEDECRTIFFTWLGLIFSIERLTDKLSRQLLAIAMDEVDNKLLNLFANEKLRESGTFVEERYAEYASLIVNDYKMFRFEHLIAPDTEGQNRLTI